MNFNHFFKAATKTELTVGNDPYEYQAELAGRDGGCECHSKLINIPTGLGKTAAVVLAWLWNRVMLGHDHWPRRLVYCLPMRTLVEQTSGEIDRWLQNTRDAVLKGEIALAPDQLENLLWLAGTGEQHSEQLSGCTEECLKKIKRPHSPIILMGGEDNDAEKNEWDIYPERPAILVGTQDMLLSRALNRGYGMSRARWPMHFGLLNNDALWVLDETQLIGVGVRTSAQLDGLREKLGVGATCATWWASATLDQRLIETFDHPTAPSEVRLSDGDFVRNDVVQRIASVKRLKQLDLTLGSNSAKLVDPHIEALAGRVVEKHQSGTVTIVIVNRVDRARKLYTALERTAKKQLLPKRVLVHSRFRRMERELLTKEISDGVEKIIIATQAIEAGVDISARTLITELAPWSSLVQRFGRCNRKGEFNDIGGADIFWVDLKAADEKDAEDLALPYTAAQLATAREMLKKVEPLGAAPTILKDFNAHEPLLPSHLLRRKDLIDLFDTTPDLAGLDIDVGRYVRDGQDRDVQVFWREKPEEKLDLIEPIPTELVQAPIAEFTKFVEKDKKRCWSWNAVEGEWQNPDRFSPGQVYLLDQAMGGYSEKLGWTHEKQKEPFKVLTIEGQASRRSPRSGHGRDDESGDQWAVQTIEEHTHHVLEACAELVHELPGVNQWAHALTTACQWHDVGKAHACFQEFITRGLSDTPKHKFVAKVTGHVAGKHKRAHFRHELLSALAFLAHGPVDDSLVKSLAAYLIAAHHGKVRLSIRSMPGETLPRNGGSESGQESQDILFARGIRDGERWPSDPSRTVEIEGFPPEGVTVDLSCMQMGERPDGLLSWTGIALVLRDRPEIGIFRLAWLETLVRAADAQGSKRS